MKIQLAKMKSDLKVVAKEITRLKSLRKDPAHNNGTGYVRGLTEAQFTYRCGHIARCMLRGRTLKEIEPKLRNPEDDTHRIVYKEAARIVASVLEAVNGTTVHSDPK